MSIFNQIHPSIYSTGTTEIVDIEGELMLAENIRFSTGYPGGFLTAKMFITRDITRSWQVRANQRLTLNNGTKIVWEGFITRLVRSMSPSGDGFEIAATGAWGAVLESRKVDKRWADDRLTQAVWRFLPSVAEDEKCRLKRDSELTFVPLDKPWADEALVIVSYYMPTGETVKKVAFTYELTTANSEDWTLGLLDASSSIIWFVNRTTDGTTTGSTAITLGTPGAKVMFYIQSDSARTPAGDGGSYGKITAVTVYSETSSINLTEIARDIITEAATISTDEALISSNTLSVEPFISNGFEALSSILVRAARQGDSSMNQWAVGFWESEKATTPDGKPVLFVEQYPALTGYEYVFRLGSGIDVELSQDFDDIYNFIIVKYKDENEITRFLTPDNDASLKDTTSISTYGQRDYLLDVGDGDTGTAADLGQRFLAARKDPQWRVSSSLRFQYFIEHNEGYLVPTSQVRAGERIRLENFLEDLSGTGLTFLITKTDYNDADETVTLTVGIPDDLAILLSR